MEMAIHKGKQALLAAALAVLVLAGCSGPETRTPAQRDGEGAAPSREVSQEAGSSAPAEEEPPAASSSPAREAPAEEPDPGELLARWEEWETLAATGEYPWTTGRGTQNRALLEEWIQALQEGEPAVLTGLALGDTTPLVYRLEAGSQGAFCTLYYPTQEGQPREERQALAAVWNGDGFLRFEGEAGGLSLLLERIPSREPIPGYAGDGDLEGAALAAQEAGSRALLFQERLAALFMAEENRQDRYGLVLSPEEVLPAIPAMDPPMAEAQERYLAGSLYALPLHLDFSQEEYIAPDDLPGGLEGAFAFAYQKKTGQPLPWQERYPAQEVEEMVMSYYLWDREDLRQSDAYDEAAGVYRFPQGQGMGGGYWEPIVTAIQEEGDTLRLTVDQYGQPSTGEGFWLERRSLLTLQLQEDGGWRYCSNLVTYTREPPIPQVTGAESLEGVPYYRVECSRGEESSGVVFLVNGETGSPVYQIEQANGTLVPLVLEEEAELLWPAP